MTNIWAVATRELRSYFLSPVAYLVAAFFVFGSGLLFWLILQSNREASLRGLIQNVHVLFLFVVPMISMRLLAEEQRLGTMELLMTNPIQEWEIVIGKFVGSALLIMSMLVATLVFPFFLFVFGTPDVGPILTGYLGAVLQGSAFLAVGLLASSLTESQIVSAVVSFVVLLALWLSDNIGQAAGGLFGQIVGYTSLINHIQGFSQGVIDSKDVVFYLTVIGAGLVLSTLSLQSKRYR
jgi:gliding motility-associated transport system permease protein